ncbi:integrase [Leptospira fluminis]|uniref:Integrase n=1 Tax=Leptospira fluminis TaxID=2484979 RepID=A0A4R9GQR0_9LEPT|nr:tyrosine-type recombinase/integrase [Leptospira fluminis]TGK20078.1 integrase [Leptospira fluminis]
MPSLIEIRRIWENGRAIVIVRSSFNSDLVRDFHRHKKATWDPIQKHWKFLFSEPFLSGLVSKYGKRIDADLDILLLPLKTELLRRNYSKKTLKAYFLYNRAFLRSSELNPYHVREEDLRSYLDKILYEKKLASVSMRSLVQSLKFYYNHVIGIPALRSYSSPKRENRIPESLSRLEVSRILNALDNLKHKLLLKICYGAGLRVSELTRLRGIDIDWERKTIRVRQGKGKKDRFSLLPDICREELSEIISRQGQNSWIFQGMVFGKCLSVRSAEKIFSNAKKAANIKKDVSIHDLRHAFAIHLLESGASIKVIQRLLGHASVKTTEIYARITDPNAIRIKSPLDL